ncbi:MAG: hypothetical protein ACM32E_05595 [Gemmatimonadota bacterium]
MPARVRAILTSLPARWPLPARRALAASGALPAGRALPASRALLAGGALLAGLTACSAGGPAGPAGHAVQPGTGHAGAATAAATAAVTAVTRLAPGYRLGNGTTYDAWITSVSPGTPARVRMELAWHYTGRAAAAYAKAHGLPSPAGDHIDVDRRFSAVVRVSPAVRASVDPAGAGPRQLAGPAFLGWAGQHPAIRVAGRYGGPLYAVTFRDDVLISVSQVFEP